MKKIITVFFFSLLILVPVFGQEEDVIITLTNQAITIDGNLDESIWNRAQDNPILIQTHPDRADPESVTTQSKILYDENYMYIAILCYDAEPDSILAITQTKDADIRDDDSVFILVESGADSDNFLFFGLNFIGTSVDGKISKDGLVLDVAWNGVWEAASQKTNFGWTAEIALERNSLLQNSRQLGLRLSRIVPRLDSSFRTGNLDPAFEFDQLGILSEISFFTDQKRMEITPYVLSQTENLATFEPMGGLDFNFFLFELDFALCRLRFSWLVKLRTAGMVSRS